MGYSRTLAFAAALALVVTSGAARAGIVEDAEAEMRKAKVALDAGEYEKAVSHYLIARTLVPDASGPYLGLGLAYAGLGRCSEAIPSLEEYLRRRKKDPFPGARATLNACRARETSPVPVRPPPPPEPRSPVFGEAPEEPNDPVVARPPPPEVQRGHLQISIEPAGRLTVNGMWLGERKTYAADLLPAVYDVVIERSGYETVNRMLLVQSGRTTIDKVVLQSSAPRIRRRNAGAAIGSILAAGVVAGVIAIGVVFGSPKPETQFSTEVIR
jgi:hypothetical protein